MMLNFYFQINELTKKNRHEQTRGGRKFSHIQRQVKNNDYEFDDDF